MEDKLGLESNLEWKMTLDGRHWREDNLGPKMILDGRQPWVEDCPGWKIPFMGEDLGWKRTSDGR